MRAAAALALLLVACGPKPGSDAGATRDAGAVTDGGAGDAAVGEDAAIASDAGRDAGAPPLGDTVTIDSGDVVGVVEDDLAIFRGIPYAAPPVGPLRFRPPERPDAFDGAFDASAFGPECVQRESGRLSGEEDCLTINVWAPTAPGPRPVMVFVHGGGFTGGAGSAPALESSALARAGDVVVLTFNYRLGAFGFLSTEALAAESEDGSFGNYGLLDQIAALEWVQRNVAAFGGDPSDVTLFGESAGAVSVCAHLGMARSDGLYHRAAIHSGGGCAGFEDPRAADGRPSFVERGAALVTAAGCDGADELGCLRALPAVDLLDAEPTPLLFIRDDIMRSLEFGPTLDGALLTEDPVDRVARGGVDVPLIVGSNADEATVFTLTRVVTRLTYEARLADHVGDETAATLVGLYPVDDFASPKAAYVAALTDLIFVCPALRFAARVGGVYAYHFTRALTGGAFGSVGAAHGLELAFLFGNFPGGYTPNAGDLALSSTMQGAWTSFARGEAPVTDPAWAPFTEAAPRVAVLDDPLTHAAEIRAGRCADLEAAGLLP